MNRIVLIGNGFDLAHDLKTRYEDFINWYWEQRMSNMINERTNVSSDVLCKMIIHPKSGCDSWSFFSYNNSFFKDPYKNDLKISGKEFITELKRNPEYFDIRYSSLMENICNNIEHKGWVDIENEYYELLKKYSVKQPSEDNIFSLNKQLNYLQEKLIEYLSLINQTEITINENIRKKIYSPIKPTDISVEKASKLQEYIDWCVKQDNLYWEDKIKRYCESFDFDYIESYKKHHGEVYYTTYPRPYMLPDNILLLSFNYTKTAHLYHNKNFMLIYIHGELENPQNIIFGYGDEMDGNYKDIQNLNNNDCLTNIKTIKYSEADNYRNVNAFIESAPFQVCIMGHSCGNSDRTLLNTLFEHKNCISIKPYFYCKEDGTDNYLELAQNISRSFTDMKLMRDRVVNKTYCEPLVEKDV